MNVELTPELEQFVELKVKAGDFADAGEVVTAALEAFRLGEDAAAAKLDQLKREVAIAIEQLDRGEGTPWDVAETKQKARRIRRNREQLREVSASPPRLESAG